MKATKRANVSKGKNIYRANVLRRQPKQPGEALAEMIRLVNLVPQDAMLPEISVESVTELAGDEAKFSAFLAALPEPLREFLADEVKAAERVWRLPEVMATSKFAANMRRTVELANYRDIRKVSEVLREVIPIMQGPLRICKRCGKVFYAARQDKKGCSPSCLNVLRIQRIKQKDPFYFQKRRTKNTKKTKQQLADLEWLAANSKRKAAK